MRKCPCCSQILVSNSSFCNICGAPLILKEISFPRAKPSDFLNILKENKGNLKDINMFKFLIKEEEKTKKIKKEKLETSIDEIKDEDEEYLSLEDSEYIPIEEDKNEENEKIENSHLLKLKEDNLLLEKEQKEEEKSIPLQKEEILERENKYEDIEITYIKEMPKEYDYLIFDEDKRKNYQIIGICSCIKYKCVAYTYSSGEVINLVNKITDEQKNYIKKFLKKGDYWEASSYIRDIFKGIKFEDTKKVLKSFAEKNKVEIKKKITLKLPIIPHKEEKKILKILKKGDIFKAIELWRKLTGLDLKKSKEQIEYLCEKENIIIPSKKRNIFILLIVIIILLILGCFIFWYLKYF